MMAALTSPLTKAQRRELEHGAADQFGAIKNYSVNGLTRHAWNLMMERLRLAGLVTPYMDGEYRITDAGRAAVAPKVGNYGFTCGYCETNLDTPFDDGDRAAQFAQEQGWRMTCGPSPRWGDGAHNTCPNCAEGDKDAIPIWMPPSKGVA